MSLLWSALASGVCVVPLSPCIAGSRQLHLWADEKPISNVLPLTPKRNETKGERHAGGNSNEERIQTGREDRGKGMKVQQNEGGGMQSRSHQSRNILPGAGVEAVGAFHPQPVEKLKYTKALQPSIRMKRVLTLHLLGSQPNAIDRGGGEGGQAMHSRLSRTLNVMARQARWR